MQTQTGCQLVRSSCNDISHPLSHAHAFWECVACPTHLGKTSAWACHSRPRAQWPEAPLIPARLLPPSTRRSACPRSLRRQRATVLRMPVRRRCGAAARCRRRQRSGLAAPLRAALPTAPRGLRSRRKPRRCRRSPAPSPPCLLGARPTARGSQRCWAPSARAARRRRRDTSVASLARRRQCRPCLRRRLRSLLCPRHRPLRRLRPSLRAAAAPLPPNSPRRKRTTLRCAPFVTRAPTREGARARRRRAGMARPPPRARRRRRAGTARPLAQRPAAVAASHATARCS